MKHIAKILTMLALALAAVSCETYIDIKHDGPENLLVANANLIAGDTLHTVYLAYSKFNDVKPVSEAHLVCYVNGTVADETSNVIEPEHYSSWVRMMQFKAKFESGDELKLVIDAGDCHVESISIVPKAPLVTKMDTSYVTVKSDSDDGQYVKRGLCEPTVQDIAGEDNFYRITMQLYSKFYVSAVDPDYDSPYYSLGEVIEYVTDDVKTDNSMDPLLYKKLDIGMDEGDGDEYNYFANKYNLFTDNTFRNGEVTLKLIVSNFRYLYNYPKSTIHSSGVTVTEDRTLRVRVLSMSRQGYTYMNDYMYDESDQSGWLMTTEMPYPSNVEGGTGMINVMAPAYYDFYLGGLNRW